MTPNQLLLIIVVTAAASFAGVLVGAWIAYRAGRGESPIPLPPRKEQEEPLPPRAKL